MFLKYTFFLILLEFHSDGIILPQIKKINRKMFFKIMVEWFSDMNFSACYFSNLMAIIQNPVTIQMNQLTSSSSKSLSSPCNMTTDVGSSWRLSIHFLSSLSLSRRWYLLRESSLSSRSSLSRSLRSCYLCKINNVDQLSEFQITVNLQVWIN